MKLRYLLAVNASLLVLVGFLFWFAPMNFLLEGYSFRPDQMLNNFGDTGEGYAPYALGRLLGVVCFGFGILLFALLDAADSEFGGKIAGALFAANLLGFLGAIAQQIAIWTSVLGWITTGAFLILAIGYGCLLLLGGQLSRQPRTVR